MDALPSELVKHILSFDLATTFAVASRVNRTWKQLALSQLSSITSLTISYSSSAPMQHRREWRAKHPLAHRTAHSPLAVVPTARRPFLNGSMDDYAGNIRRLLRACSRLEDLVVDGQLGHMRVPLLPPDAIRCPSLKSLVVYSSCNTANIASVADNHPHLEELDWIWETDYCDVGWKHLDLPTLLHLKKECPNLRSLPKIWLNSETINDGDQFVQLLSVLHDYGWEGMNLIRFHTYVDEYEFFVDFLRSFAEAPGEFTGVIELDASFTQDEDEVGCEEWFGEHVHIILRELRM